MEPNPCCEGHGPRTPSFPWANHLHAAEPFMVMGRAFHIDLAEPWGPSSNEPRGEPLEKEANKVKEVEHGEKSEVERTFSTDIFATENGTRISHFNMNLLLPRHEVFNDLVDCWAAVLNFEEKIRSPSSLRRLFCPTTPFYGWILDNPDETNESRFYFFETHIHVVLEGNEKLYDLKQFDVVMFPIFKKHHFFLMSFDMKNLSIRLIDNMHDSECIVGFCDDNYIFLLYLKIVDHPKLKELEGLRVEKLKISWATTKNFVDCGIF
ncbi:hypothetical protein R6Q59_001790, partial [Mikania micrantha]